MTGRVLTGVVCALAFAPAAQADGLQVRARPLSLDPTMIETTVHAQVRGPGVATIEATGLLLPNHGTIGSGATVRVKLRKGRNRIAETLYVQQSHEETRRRTWRPAWLNPYVWVRVPDPSNAVVVSLEVRGVTVERVARIRAGGEDTHE